MGFAHTQLECGEAATDNSALRIMNSEFERTDKKLIAKLQIVLLHEKP